MNAMMASLFFLFIGWVVVTNGTRFAGDLFLIAAIITGVGLTEGVPVVWWVIAGLALLTSITQSRYWPAIKRWISRWKMARKVRRAEDPSSLTGREFERWTAEQLEQEGYSTEVTGGPGDGGCDVLAQRAGRKVAVQCKCLSSSVGTGAVQEAVTARALHDAHEAWVVTTAPSVTAQAENLARRTGVEIHQV